MSKTSDYVKSGKGDFSEKEIKFLEELEEEWESEGSIHIGSEDDDMNYYGTDIEYDEECNVTVTTHGIFCGETDGEETVLDGIDKGKLSWESLLEDYSDTMLEVFEEDDEEDEED